MTTLDQLASLSATQVDLANSQRDTQMLADDFDTFLQLLTTQLRNQDPLEPMDTNEFTNQLVQFSGIEQQIQTNTYLETLITSSQAQAVNAVVGYLGTNVTAEGVATNLADGSASWTLQSNIAAGASTIRISDENGREVFSAPHALAAGKSSYTWDGRTSTGQPAPEGLYRIQVQGSTTNGDPVDVDTAISGKVTSVDVTGGEPVLYIEDVQVRLSSIQRVDAAQ